MPELERVGTLDVHQDLGFQRREWVVQRIGWGLIFLVVAAALGGFFGSGPASKATAGDPGSGLWVAYERFARRGAPLTLRVHARPDAQEFRLELDRRYMEAFKVEHITPEPLSAEASATALVYTFRADPAADALFTFHLHAQSIGPQQARLRAAGTDVEFRQFIYP